VMILSSDGIVEAMNESRELYGFERFTTCVAQAPQGSAREIHDYILAGMRAFSGQAEIHDDVTLIVVVIGET
jgi:serine phosphatase RsbU (regulator of sigma subunit)